jgi:DNA adenine methylase
MNRVTRDDLSQPFLRWAGSKRQLVPLLAPYFAEQHKRYVEPFAGSACLFFAIGPKRALLGDINTELMATYDAVRDSADAVAARLGEWSNDRDSYLLVRDIDPADLDSTGRAARFIYLNRLCFNGLYRTNREGRFNVPYGGLKSGTMPTATWLRACADLLRGARFVAGDFEKIIARVRPGDFVYMDPPFRVEGRRVFGEYDPASFSADDLVRLRKAMARITRKDASFVVSYADCDEAVELGRGYRSATVKVRRNIAGFASKRTVGTEVLIFSDDLKHG